MIYYFTAYDINKNIGKSYNSCLELLQNNNDFACFTDGDSMFTVPDFGHQINEITIKYPQYSIFTAVTNRIGRQEQCVQGMWNVEDLNKHFEKGLDLQNKFRYELDELTKELSGVLILIKKSTWLKIGKFNENLGILGVDNDIWRNAIKNNFKVMIMKGVYLLHYYRNGNKNNVNHLL